MSLAERLIVPDGLDAWLRDTRRLIHINPELMLEERETSELVQKHLTEVGVPFRSGVGGDGRPLYLSKEVMAKAGITFGATTGGTGVLAEIHGTRGAGHGKCVLLRADMDALPIEEANDVQYRSRVPGKMHACGHDVHTTALMGVAEVLSGLTDLFDGTVKLMFQPGEEGAGGAAAMINDGILNDPSVDAAFALHVTAELRAGHVSAGAGPFAAAADTFEIRVTGKGGHAAFPHTTIDTTLVAAHILIALQSLVSREVDPLETAVVTVGKLESGTIHNVIPQTATLLGTVRTYTPQLRNQLEARIAEMASAIASAFRAEAEIIYLRGYPPMINHPAAVDLVRDVGVELLGAENVHEARPIMAGEDMAFVLEAVPGCLFNLGVGNPERGLVFPPHHPRFDADEDALSVGVRMLCGVALRYLNADV
ncbi:MAG TPA: M20 family metallopeptidase [Thermomicrobiales bacterium]|nr:M20 family metallopeptidase [Thermomicrobiales bacterium]